MPNRGLEGSSSCGTLGETETDLLSYEDLDCAYA